MTPTELKKALFREMMAYSTKDKNVEILDRSGKTLTKAEYKAKVRQPISKAVRRDVLLRDGTTCHYCGERTTKQNRHLDHMDGDRSRSTVDNLTVSCKRCNSTKGNTPYRDYIIKYIKRLELHIANLKKL